MRELFDAAEPQAVVGVRELIERLRDTFERDYGELWVEGEVGSLHRSRAGHLYFDLKEEDGQLRCAMFRLSASDLAFELEEGMLVRARASLDVYPERGSLQLIVRQLVPAGEGALRLAFERMKRRLDDEGLFAVEHKQQLPRLPDRIGLVTSLAGAAIHDFIRGLRRRHASVDVVVYDARVQGENAWRELVRGLHLLDADPTIPVIVLARGGGSLEDLWNFNREELVRAVYELNTPLVSAVGHEVDVMLVDLAADVRAATPTAAAELVVSDGSVLLAQVDAQRRRLVQRQRVLLEARRQRLALLERGLIHPAERLAELRRRLGAGGQRLRRAGRGGLERRGGALGTLSGRLDALSPLAVLGRGYALARRVPDGSILRASGDAPVGSEIDVRLAQGALRATVTRQEEDG